MPQPDTSEVSPDIDFAAWDQHYGNPSTWCTSLEDASLSSDVLTTPSSTCSPGSILASNLNLALPQFGQSSPTSEQWPRVFTPGSSRAASSAELLNSNDINDGEPSTQITGCHQTGRSMEFSLTDEQDLGGLPRGFVPPVPSAQVLFSQPLAVINGQVQHLRTSDETICQISHPMFISSAMPLRAWSTVPDMNPHVNTSDFVNEDEQAAAPELRIQKKKRARPPEGSTQALSTSKKPRKKLLGRDLVKYRIMRAMKACLRCHKLKLGVCCTSYYSYHY